MTKTPEPTDSELEHALTTAQDTSNTHDINQAAWALLERHRGWVVDLTYRRALRRWDTDTREDWASHMLLAAHRAITRWRPIPGGRGITGWVEYITRSELANFEGATAHPVSVSGYTELARHNGHAPRDEPGSTTARRENTLAPATRIDTFDRPDTAEAFGAVDEPMGDVHTSAMASALLAAVADLPEREREAVTRWFGLEGDREQLPEIAEEWGMSHEATRQAAHRGLDRLAHPATLSKILRAR